MWVLSHGKKVTILSVKERVIVARLEGRQKDEEALGEAS